MKNTVKILVFALSFALSANAFCSSPDEKDGLKGLADELSFLREHLSTIKSKKRIDDTESFDYDALENDLREIEEAVRRHVELPSRQPRTFQPLSLDYESVR